MKEILIHYNVDKPYRHFDKYNKHTMKEYNLFECTHNRRQRVKNSGCRSQGGAEDCRTSVYYMDREDSDNS